jgi:uncharacterized protein (DUF488 family)
VSVVYTIGYEGTDIERFVRTLTAVGVRQVADVRAIALSRKRGFSKRALSERLAAERIRYAHFAGLGTPKEGRDAARGGDHDEFLRIYAAHLRSRPAQEAFRSLLPFVTSEPTCLLCFERNPQSCHRSLIAAELRAAGLETFDLYGDEPERYAGRAARARRWQADNMGAIMSGVPLAEFRKF